MAESVKVSQEHIMGAGSLGSQLDQLDNLIGRLGLGDRRNGLAILRLMDQIDEQFKALRVQGAAIKAEESQFEASSASLKNEARRLVEEMGGKAALQEERSARKSPASAWWWFLDDYLAQKRSQAIRRNIKILAVVALAIGILALAYKLFLAPDPKIVAVYDALNASQSLAGQGNYGDALIQVQKGLAAAPGTPELLIMEGVIYTMQGKVQQAADDFASARAQLQNDEQFYVTQSQDYLTINQPAPAAQSAQAAIKVNASSARGYFLLGSAQEIAGDSNAAYASYDKTVQLAEAAGDSTLAVQAKIKMGYLLQGAGTYPTGIPATATP